MSTKRLLAIHAHPDDESSKGAATTAKYAAEGAEVLVVTCTGGERGDIINPAMDRPGVLENMGSIRREEMGGSGRGFGRATPLAWARGLGPSRKPTRT